MKDRTRRDRHRLLPAAALVAAIAAACSAVPAQSTGATGPSPAHSLERGVSSPPGDRLPKSSDQRAVGEVPESLLDAVRENLAARLGRDVSAATVVRAEPVVWNDGSLGCPEPGMFYTQALVPGYHVVLELDGVRYDYRSGEQGLVRLCESPAPGGQQP